MKRMLKRVIKALRGHKVKWTESPFSSLEDRNSLNAGRDALIPKKVYQTFRFNSFGKTHYQQIQAFRKMNPDMEFLFFDEKARDLWMDENWGGRKIHEIYNNLLFGPARADIFRYCILFSLGGYYFDISKGCRVPLSSLHKEDSRGLISFEQNDVFITPDSAIIHKLQEPGKYVLQWGLGFVAGHPILECVIKNIEDDYNFFKGRRFENPKSAILMFTGPGQFTKSVRQAFLDYPDISLTQAGIDFNGKGIFAMEGSEARYLLSSPYAEVRNAMIVE